MSDWHSLNSPQNTISFYDKLWFICGHVHMDLCGAYILTYLLFFLSQNVGLSATHVGIIFFVAQKIDENELNSILSTPSGRRISHIWGSLIMIILIPTIFHHISFETKTFVTGNNWALFFYYVVLIMIASLGHSIVHISNMAEIALLNVAQSERRILYHIRFGSKCVTTMLVCLIFYFFNHRAQNAKLTLTSSNDNSYEIVSYVLAGLGALSTIIFQFKKKKQPNGNDTTAPKLDASSESMGSDVDLIESCGMYNAFHKDSIDIIDNENSLDFRKLKIKDLFKILDFCPVAFCYLCGKLMVNITQIYCILYLVNFINLDKTMSNLVALIIQFGGVIATPLMYFSSRFFGHKGTMIVGLILASVVSACYGTFDIENIETTNIIIQQLFLSMFLGIASTFLTLSAHDLIVNISEKDKNISTILSFFNFVDKALTGLTVLILQVYLPKCNSAMEDPTCLNKLKFYYKYIMFGFPTGCTIVICVLLCVIIKKDIYPSPQPLEPLESLSDI